MSRSLRGQTVLPVHPSLTAVRGKTLQSYGAVGGTRTLTLVTEQRPQRCASTNSATTAMSWTGLRFNSRVATCQVPNRKIPFRIGATHKSLSINAGQQN